jgi:hypothetical protein
MSQITMAREEEGQRRRVSVRRTRLGTEEDEVVLDMSEGVPELSAEVFSGCCQVLAREQYRRKIFGRWKEGKGIRFAETSRGNCVTITQIAFQTYLLPHRYG